MQTWDKNLLFNYKPSIETYKKGMIVTEKLGKLNVRIASVFASHNMPSRIFAFIESKYSSRIEGIYTTLFDVVNTGIESKQQKLIEPLVKALYSDNKIIDLKKINKIEDIMNSGVSKSKRWENEFGIYKTINDKKIKIYDPCKNKEQVSKLLTDIVSKADKDDNLVDMIHTHILFEKIHPFVEANGRIGRLILQRAVSKLMNFVSVIPLSWAFLKQISNYYEAFDIKSNEDLDKGIQNILDILLLMYKQTKAFIIELDKFKKQYINIVKNTSRTVTNEIAERILLTLQTKSSYLNDKFGLNPKTIDSIFNKLQKDIDFNKKIVKRKKAFWNIELESLIDNFFN